MTVPARIVGADRLIHRFGHWPSFHDAEVKRVTLDSQGVGGPTAEMLVHTWAMTDKTDEKGYFVLEKHTLVRLVFERLASCELSDFRNPPILLGVAFETETVDSEELVRVTLAPCSGFGGTLTCERVVVTEVTPCDADGHPTVEE